MKRIHATQNNTGIFFSKYVFLFRAGLGFILGSLYHHIIEHYYLTLNMCSFVYLSLYVRIPLHGKSFMLQVGIKGRTCQKLK